MQILRQSANLKPRNFLVNPQSQIHKFLWCSSPLIANPQSFHRSPAKIRPQACLVNFFKVHIWIKAFQAYICKEKKMFFADCGSSKIWVSKSLNCESQKIGSANCKSANCHIFVDLQNLFADRPPLHMFNMKIDTRSFGFLVLWEDTGLKNQSGPLFGAYCR